MNISLTPILEQFIQDKVTSGLYNSSSEVIRDALRLLIEDDSIRQKRIEQLNRDIEVGLAELDAGKGIPSEEVFAYLEKKLQDKMRKSA